MMAAPAAALPRRFLPQLATLVASPPVGEAWLHEIKFDGYRIGCRIDGDDVRLLSRNEKDWTNRFPEIRAAAGRLGVRRALLDGEVAVLDADGRTSFQRLQQLDDAGRERLVYYVFDLLHVDGEDVTRLPLETRKQRLAAMLRGARASTIRYSDHVIGGGAAFLAEACRLGLEGVVSKRRDAPYVGRRTDAWRKTKCTKRQEFVIGGFTDPEGSRAGIGALLLGVHDPGGRLVFAGKVGTGFTQARAQELRRRLDALERAACPFTALPAGPLGRRAHWVDPTLVAEVAFTEWTDDGKVRHASFQGLRDDRRPASVTRERARRPGTS